MIFINPRDEIIHRFNRSKIFPPSEIYIIKPANRLLIGIWIGKKREEVPMKSGTVCGQQEFEP